MRPIRTTLSQTILNKLNNKIDFTHYLKESSKKKRYIVSIKEIYKGTNPSLDFELRIRLSETINTNAFDSVGGWYNKETNLYCVDANLHFDDIVKAQILGAANKQIAIFDSVENKVIYLNN